MTGTILASVSYPDTFDFVPAISVRLIGRTAPMREGLELAQLREVLEQVQSSLAKRGLARVERLMLTFMSEGCPVMTQTWRHVRDEACSRVANVFLSEGHHLYLASTEEFFVPEVPVVLTS